MVVIAKGSLVAHAPDCACPEVRVNSAESVVMGANLQMTVYKPNVEYYIKQEQKWTISGKKKNIYSKIKDDAS
ncbi:hypothetical protein NDU88_006123 [Pleurodeles waltl]|uniref:Uncharacterized protein n=1 Tax=Pleurodeles waltl TaxID=8319 RepID=A0AAV7VL06_PLEWA|nr:hypothetical protein NDU88_006123 [Pleurodeles waltl]